MSISQNQYLRKSKSQGNEHKSELFRFHDLFRNYMFLGKFYLVSAIFLGLIFHWIYRN